MLDRIDAVCRHTYTLALLLAALTCVLTPLHVMATQLGNVTRVMPDNRIEVSVGDLPGAEAGDTVQVYRFNPDWMKPIGPAQVTEIRGDQVVLSFDPTEYAWPMGIQGAVVDVADGQLVLNVGTEIGVTQGQRLNLFRERQRVGTLRVVNTTEGSSRATLLNLDGRGGPNVDPTLAMGLVAGPYVIPNQVGLFAQDWLGAIEVFAILGVLGLWLWTVNSPVPGMLLEREATRIKTAIAEAPQWAKYIQWSILGFFTCYVGAQIATWFWVKAPQYLWNDIRAIEQYVGFIPSSNLIPNLPLPDLTDVPWLVTLAAMVGWAAVMVSRQDNPLKDVLEFIRFRRDDSLIYRIFSWAPRGALNWVLHWAVFYLFARNLLGFLKNNMRAAANVGWAEHQLPFATWGDWFSSSFFMLTHLPAIYDYTAFFDTARYLTWSACIVGCLIGYGHTIVSILWKKDAIKWVDFTLTGWMVNLICYGAWASAVFQVFPHPAGQDPTVTAGPLLILMPFTELFLNVVYTISIFNMGPKFGVMVDKGLVDRGFYSVVRHPSYTLEPLMFSVLYMNRTTNPLAAIGLLAHPFMYWWRSERDDHFMGQANPDYPEYRERVPYKYIPGVW